MIRYLVPLLLLAALPARAAAPTVPAVQDWAGDSIANGCRALGLPKPVADRLIARVQSAIAEGAAPCQQGYARLKAVAAAAPGPQATADAAQVFASARSVIAIRDHARAETYGVLPPRNRARALVYAEEQAARQRGNAPAGLEAAFAYLLRDRGKNLSSLIGADPPRTADLLPRVQQLADARRRLRERRTKLFARLGRATRAVAKDPELAALLSDWQDLEAATTALDRSQLAEVERTLTPAEKVHAAQQVLPMIDRGMRWAAIYFKVRGAFNRRDVKADAP